MRKSPFITCAVSEEALSVLLCMLIFFASKGAVAGGVGSHRICPAFSVEMADAARRLRLGTSGSIKSLVELVTRDSHWTHIAFARHFTILNALRGTEVGAVPDDIMLDLEKTGRFYDEDGGHASILDTLTKLRTKGWIERIDNDAPRNTSPWYRYRNTDLGLEIWQNTLAYYLGIHELTLSHRTYPDDFLSVEEIRTAFHSLPPLNPKGFLYLSLLYQDRATVSNEHYGALRSLGLEYRESREKSPSPAYYRAMRGFSELGFVTVTLGDGKFHSYQLTELGSKAIVINYLFYSQFVESSPSTP